MSSKGTKFEFKKNGENIVKNIFYFAWVILVLGIIGAIVIWREFALVETRWESGIDSAGVAYTIYTLLVAGFFSGLLFGIAVIAQNSIRSNRKLDMVLKKMDTED